ncbi:hypothetical protein [Burkholderia diffusa]|uniref:hypothetical protein n=1 Tax=Burkholderia diffusa TaxID=488732 RepID=UPI0015885114|nr:hypothetical protein [Burkholderia diffusa]
MSEPRLLPKNTYADGTGIGHRSHEVEDAHGRCFKGTLDVNGQVDTFASDSYRGVRQWPAPPTPTVSRCAEALAALAMKRETP